MAGGPNAAIVMCLNCTGKAVRTYEGMEDDHYRCEDCGEKFGMDWSRRPPQKQCWPPSEEDLEMAKKILEIKGMSPPRSRWT